jgi:carboxypeptidase A4
MDCRVLTLDTATIKTSDFSAAALPDPSFFESYHELEAHDSFLSDLQAAFPDNSELFSVGDSVEGRPINGIHLYGAGGPGKPAVIWHGTVHAREWVTAPVSLHT